MKSVLVFLSGWLLLVIPELLRIYFIMPFPGSQNSDTVSIAYFLHRYILLFRITGVIIIAIPLYRFILSGKWWQKIMVVLLAGFAGIVFYLTTQVMQADKMFLTPHHRIFANVTDNAVNENQLVTGYEINGAASCYPIQIIAYHHKVYDTVGGTPVL
ncbi:MAG: hypothetical protein WBB36_01475, partial [Chitinophagales bacterium]